MINQQPNKILIFQFYGSEESYTHSLETVLGILVFSRASDLLSGDAGQ